MAWIIVGAVLAALVALLALIKPRDRGGGHDQYFGQLDRAMKDAGIGTARIVIDEDRLTHNLSVILANIPSKDHYRIAVKSLPCIELLRFIQERVGTRKFMVVHRPFLKVILENFDPGIDILLGKPIPVQGMKEFFREIPRGLSERAQAEIQWLIDTPLRLEEYLAYARQNTLKLRVNLEIDIGLHRGGIDSAELLIRMLDVIQANPDRLSFSGFMGYEGHVAHAPALLRPAHSVAVREFADNLAVYRKLIEAGCAKFPDLFSGPLTFNSGGSGTYSLFCDHPFITDIGIGGAVLRPAGYPGHFLVNLEPAQFIAAPVLKKRNGILIPFIEGLCGLLAFWDPNNQRTFEIYGGGWAGHLVSPSGTRTQALTADPPNQNLVPNQTTLTGSRKVALEIGDFVFYHPLQSDAMFQFEDILVVSQGRVDRTWKIFPRRY